VVAQDRTAGNNLSEGFGVAWVSCMQCAQMQPVRVLQPTIHTQPTQQVREAPIVQPHARAPQQSGIQSSQLLPVAQSAPRTQNLQLSTTTGPSLTGDPFDLMDSMLASISGDSGTLFAGTNRGMDQLLQHMDDQMSIMGSQVQGAGEGAYACQTMAFSSNLGADGKMQTERIATSAVGDAGRQIHEIQQVYSNNSQGVKKMSLEQKIGDQSLKRVKEQSLETGEHRQTELFRGMQEGEVVNFEQRWQRTAAPQLPVRRVGVATPTACGAPPKLQALPATISGAQAKQIQAGHIGAPLAALPMRRPQAVPIATYTAGIR